MNIGVYIFGKFSSGYLQYPDEKFSSKIFKRFNRKSIDESQVIIHRDKHLMYYSYIRVIGKGKYLGLCAILNDLSLTRFRPLFDAFENTIDYMARHSLLVEYDTFDNVVPAEVTVLYNEQVDQITSFLRNQINEKLGSDITKIPPESFDVDKDEAGFFRPEFTPEDDKKILDSTVKKGYTYLYKNSTPEALEELVAQRRRRKIKKCVAAVCLIAFVAILCATNYDPAKPFMYSQNVEIDKFGGKTEIPLTPTDGDWRVLNGSGDWYNLAITNDTLNVSVATNHGDARSAKIRFEFPSKLFGIELSKEVRYLDINQPSGLATYAKVSTDKISFDKYGKAKGVSTFTLDSDGVPDFYEYEDENIQAHAHRSMDHCPNWLTLNKNGDIYEVKARKNGEKEKSGQIEINVGGIKKVISVNQDSGLANYLRVSRSYFEIPEEGSTVTINVDTDGVEWTYGSTYWSNIEYKATDNKLTVEIPSTNYVRDFEVAIESNNGHRQTVRFFQNGDPSEFDVSSSTLNPSQSGRSYTIDVENNSKKSLSVDENLSWVSAYPSGRNKVKINVDRNNGEPQYGTVYVTCGGKKKSISIKQDGYKKCGWCRNGYVYCGICQNGYVNTLGFDPYTGYQYYYPTPCWSCGGHYKKECSHCHGDGRIPVKAS